ncbi:hypothetical protein GGS21DRAFT_139578 [Xylaria nigripes]|nr:hypothetical protein GGS21DRAFT_139578 [Xylaria nigripes]
MLLFQVFTRVTLVGAVLLPGTWAGVLDHQHQQQDFKMDVSTLQNQLGLQMASTNLNVFTGALGGAEAPPITSSNDSRRPYEVNGEAVSNFRAAIDKACGIQMNECKNLVADGVQNKGGFSVSDCDKQSSRCNSFLKVSATQTAFLSKVTVDGNDDFDFFCEN